MSTIFPAPMLNRCQNDETPHLHNQLRQRLSALYRKAEKKGRSKAEVDQVIRWLTGYSQTALNAQVKKNTSFEAFFAAAPKLNPSRSLITGVICGVRIEDIEEALMRENSLSGQADRRTGEGESDGEDPPRRLVLAIRAAPR